MPYEEKLEYKACEHCEERKLLNQWDLCEDCSQGDLELQFVDGQVKEKNTWRGGGLKDVDSFTSEQIIEFLSNSLKISNARLVNAIEKARAFRAALKDLENV